MGKHQSNGCLLVLYHCTQANQRGSKLGKHIDVFFWFSFSSETSNASGEQIFKIFWLPNSHYWIFKELNKYFLLHLLSDAHVTLYSLILLL